MMMIGNVDRKTYIKVGEKWTDGWTNERKRSAVVCAADIINNAYVRARDLALKMCINAGVFFTFSPPPPPSTPPFPRCLTR